VINNETVLFYKDKTVLVTGGGGSIGSEIARLVAKCQPKKLIIVDIYENNAYDIQQELRRTWGDSLSLEVEIASVRDRARLDAIFAYYRPDVVFHAAAHKHVPLMEHSNCEAVKNNVLGTYNTADMAEKYGVKKFILISTDKAVNPTNVMGASKRMCEMVVQSRNNSDTVFAAVRFGNVLGSNGSVIPLFKRQIENGGPVTVTDKRIIRYFMTIPEASGLVMQAGAMARCGELFVLDMGKPVKIIDLATNMIKLSGYNPYIDIDIVETGLRPGEKLYEELLIKTEKLDKTENNLIFIERDTPLSREEVDRKIARLTDAVKRCESEIGAPYITEVMKEEIPTFRSPEEINKSASESDEMKLCHN
ncbi:MAG: polysaccharide biosynthesis protein, partial [Clostridia bacterium]|nr:polysaccharide biosynthesis protein [Clostridia bacterium]